MCGSNKCVVWMFTVDHTVWGLGRCITIARRGGSVSVELYACVCVTLSDGSDVEGRALLQIVTVC